MAASSPGMLSWWRRHGASRPTPAAAPARSRSGLCFTLKGGLAEVDRLIQYLQLAVIAPSLADVATSISHPGKLS